MRGNGGFISQGTANMRGIGGFISQETARTRRLGGLIGQQTANPADLTANPRCHTSTLREGTATPMPPTASPARSAATLVALAQDALELTHRDFGPLLGASLRTAERWAARRSTPTQAQLAKLAGHVYAHDPALAAEIATAAGQTLGSLGIGPRTPEASASATAPSQLVDSVVCQAAEAMDVSPRAIRPALLAAFARARELGLDVAAIADALAPPAKRPPKPATPSRAER
jgi:hypothetical protein